MKSILQSATLCGLLALAGCAGLKRTDPYLQIQPGMEAAQVESLLGAPIDRKFTGGHDEWTYRMDMGKGIQKTKIVVFDDRKVVALADDSLSAQREFELARARALNPQAVMPAAPGQERNQLPPTNPAISGGPLVMPPTPAPAGPQTPPPVAPPPPVATAPAAQPPVAAQPSTDPSVGTSSTAADTKPTPSAELTTEKKKSASSTSAKHNKKQNKIQKSKDKTK